MLTPTVVMVLHAQSGRLESSKPIVTVFKEVLSRSSAQGKQGVADRPSLGGF